MVRIGAYQGTFGRVTVSGHIPWAYQERSLYQPKGGLRIVTYQEHSLYHCVSVLYQWYHNGFAYHTSDSVRRCVSVFVSVCIMRTSDEH